MGRPSRLCAKGAKGMPNICATRARGDKNRECGVRLGAFSNRMPFCRVAPRVLPAGVEWCKRRCFCGPGNGAIADRRLTGRRHDAPGERPTSDAMGRAENCRDAGRSVEAFVEAWPVLGGLFCASRLLSEGVTGGGTRARTGRCSATALPERFGQERKTHQQQLAAHKKHQPRECRRHESVGMQTNPQQVHSEP
jgi:hypothetical protein